MNIDKKFFETSEAWPFVEARNLLKKRIKILEKKGYALFETGYGPSGLPHIGTFGEVCRTSMVLNAFKKLSNIPVKLFAFSDDLDGLRKVPDNIPNKSILEENLHKPLTAIPDPFNKFKSFGEHNNNMLKKFLDDFNFKYEFKSSTELYTKGIFDEALISVLKNYNKIMDVVLPTLGPERRKTYSPFLPICPDTGRVLEVQVLEQDLEKKTIVYLNNNKKIETKITGGACKLQWKVDWAMRWHALEVDFEMYGKDLTPSAELSQKICKILGSIPPSGFPYELFLDEKGEKISKSKGNGITIEQWLKYASPESLSLYMYQNPTQAKKLYFNVIAKAVDEYLSFLEKFKTQAEKEKLGNPVWHIHDGNPPQDEIPVSFNMLLNLVSVSNTDKEDVIWKFIQNFHPNLTKDKHPILSKLVRNAINYFNDVVKINKKFKKPDQKEKLALQDLVKEISSIENNLKPEDIQTMVYSVGKKHYSKETLRDWFKMIYEVLFGEEQGPRMGSFICFYGIKETIDLINRSIRD